MANNNYLIPLATESGSTVVANPTIAGTEPVLSSVAIDGKVYQLSGGDVEGADVESTGASAGQVLMADGNGGAAWQTIPNANGEEF